MILGIDTLVRLYSIEFRADEELTQRLLTVPYEHRIREHYAYPTSESFGRVLDAYKTKAWRIIGAKTLNTAGVIGGAGLSASGYGISGLAIVLSCALGFALSVEAGWKLEEGIETVLEPTARADS